MKTHYQRYILLLFLGIAFGQSQWNVRPSGTKYDFIEVKAVDPATAYAFGNGYNGSWNDGVILRTTNAGSDWNIIAYSPSPIASMNTVGSKHSWFVGGGFNGATTEPFIKYSTNKGIEWEQRSGPGSKSLTSVYFLDSLNGWCAGEGRGMFRSTNGGVNWTKLPDFSYALIRSLYFSTQQHGFAVGYDLYRTTDSGVSWSLHKDFGSHKSNKVFFVNKDSGWASGNGLWRTVDGGISWALIDSVNSFSSISFINSKNGYAVINGSVLTTTNGGATWIDEFNLSGMSSVNMFNPSFGAAVGSSGLIYSYQPLELIRPKTNDILKVGDWFHIQWKSSISAATISLEFSSDGGEHWTAIANNVSVAEGGYYWKIPNVITENAKMRLYSPTNAALYAFSDGNIQIQPQLTSGSWSSSAIENNQIGKYGEHPRAVPDGSGGIILAWVHRNYPIQSEEYNSIKVQRLSSSGAVLWDSEGISAAIVAKNQNIPRMVQDGYGGVLIVWMQYDGINSENVYAQRIDGSGNRLWGKTGVPICVAPGDQSEPSVMLSEDGGIIVTWQDSRAQLTNNTDIFAQKIDRYGKSVWPQNGIPISQHTGPQTFPKLCSDGNGGAFIVWGDFVSNTSYDIYAQRIDRNGNIKFLRNGIIISDNKDFQVGQDLVAIEAGQAIITWKDIGDFHKTKVQKVDTNGVVFWNANGVSISTHLGTSEEPSIVADGMGGCLIANYTMDSSKVFVQRIAQSGAKLWGDQGLLICNNAKSPAYPLLSNVANNTASVAWWDRRNGNDDVYVQRISLNGSILWTNDGVQVCIQPSRQSFEKDIVFDGSNGQTVVVWRDERNSPNGTVPWDIYASMIGPTGMLGSGTTFVQTSERYSDSQYSLLQNYPNPFNPTTTIPFTIPIRSSVTVTIHDLLGRQVETVFDDVVGPGEHRVLFDATNLSSGIYFYRLSINDHVWANLTQVKAMQVIK